VLEKPTTTTATARCPASARRMANNFFAYHGIWAPGIRMFRRVRFPTKALILALALTLPLLLLLAVLWSLSHDQSLQSRLDATRQHVEIAHGILRWARAQVENGNLTQTQAQQLALRQLATLRYDGNEYFWVNDMQPRMVMHPVKPELNGKDLRDFQDPTGNRLFQQFVSLVEKQGKGFVRYQWPKPGSDHPVDKVSYVMGFDDWGWIIGSGVYIDDVRAAARQGAAWIAAVLAAVMAVGGYLFICFCRVIDGGLRETSRHLRAMTSGDLTTTPRPWGTDEAADLLHELQAMQASVAAIVSRVRQSSTGIVGMSRDIAAGAEDLSTRTELAAANLQVSTAAMDQIASTVQRTAEHTAEASHVANAGAAMAAHGGQAMCEMVQTMDNIRTSATTVCDIINTVNGIAFQTNLLALNAAVEAARAGDHGRGFTVVAHEVRTLAQRCACAAQEIQRLITHTVQQVEAGADRVRASGKTIGEMVQASHRVDTLLAAVATSAVAQNREVTQVAGMFQELDRMTQQNAALVDRTAAAAVAMRAQADALASEVDRFRTA